MVLQLRFPLYSHSHIYASYRETKIISATDFITQAPASQPHSHILLQKSNRFVQQTRKPATNYTAKLLSHPFTTCSPSHPCLHSLSHTSSRLTTLAHDMQTNRTLPMAMKKKKKRGKGEKKGEPDANNSLMKKETGNPESSGRAGSARLAYRVVPER